MNETQLQRLRELETYARKNRDEATEKPEKDKWTNVLAWCLLIENAE